VTAPPIPWRPALPAGLARYLRDSGEAQPETADPGGPGAGRPRRWPAASGRWFLLAWLVALIVLAANDPGRMIFDTKLGVDIDAAGFFERLWPLWNPLEWFGTLQDQYIGYAIPMAPFFLIGQVLQLPVWMIERLWLSLAIAGGFWGMTKLATALRIGSDGSRLLAGAAFALWPTFTIIIGSTSGGALPGLLVPWAVLPLATALQGRRSIAAASARSGVAIMLMGGVNAVSTLCVLVAPALFILTHTRGARRVKACLCWGTAVVAATAWWALPLLLQGRYSFNFLPYVEQSATTTKTMSADALLRGAGNWTAYLNLGSPWLSAGWATVANPAAIAASAAAAAAGLYGLARRDMPEQLWLRLCVGLAALAALAGYPGAFGGPLHGLVGTLLNGSLAPFRSVSKFEPVIALALALGIAHAAGQAWHRALPAPKGSRRMAARVALAPIIALGLAGLALPYLTNQILQPGSFTSVPRYWYQVASFLAVHSKNQTALVVPGDSHGIYVWGDTIDEPLEPLDSSPWAERSLVPYGGAGSQVFASTVESAIESGQQVPGLAAYLQRAGVRYVVVRNDLSPTQIGYTQPRIVLQTLALSGFTRVAAFGPLVTGTQTNTGTPRQVQAYLPRYPAIEVFQAASAGRRASSPVAALPVSATALVNGGPDSLLQLEGQGILGDRAAVIAGDQLAARPDLWAVTDGQRRQDNAFGLINANTSFTYTAGETNPVDDPLGGGGAPPRQILPVPAGGHQTVTVLSGAASVTASSYGSWLYYEPQYDPVNAFDGNAATAWAEGNPTTPVGQWIQITFDHPLDLPDHIGVQLLDDGFSRSIANQLQVSTAAGRISTATAPTGATQQLRVRAGPTKWLRITITEASNVIRGNPGAGIRDVLIPGVRVTPYLKPAQDSAGRAATSVAFSFHQAPPAPAGEADQGATEPFARLFTLPAARRLRLTAQAVAQPGTGLDALLGRLAPPGRSALEVGAPTWGSLPEFGPDNLFTPRSTTPWISGSSDPVISMSWHGYRRISEIVVQPAYGLAATPTTIKVSSFFGTREATVGLDGVATLYPPLTTDQLNVSFPGWSSDQQPAATSGQPVLGLAKLTIPALSGLRVTGPNPGTRFSLACGQGPVIALDGRNYQTAVTGTLGELAGTLPVSVRPCTSGSAVTLGSGQHRLLVSPGLFTMTDVALQAGPTSPVSAATPGRAVRVLSWQPDNRTAAIGPGQESYLEVHQNANPGWEATLDGRRLASATLDGWQQAYVVPAGAGGVITMTFAPGTWYHAGLGLSALAIIALVAVAAGWRRWMSYAVAVGALAIGRFRPARKAEADRPVPVPAPEPLASPDAGDQARHRAGRPFAAILPWARPLAVAGLIILVGGPLVLAVPVLAVIAALRPRWLPAVSLAAMLAAGLIAATAAAPAAVGSGAFGPAGQACALVALAAALYPSAATAGWTGRWRPARPLPATGGGAQLPASGQPRPITTGGLNVTRTAGGMRHAATASPASQAVAGASTFKLALPGSEPLRRVPFGIADELSCYYDSLAEPCNVHVEVRVPAHLDPAALRRATTAALAAQPRALVRRAAGAWWRRYAWEVPGQPDCDPLTAATWADESELALERARFLAVAPTLRRSPPVRILLASGPGEDRIILNAHHAALDGISCLELLRNVSRHYPGGPTSPGTAAAQAAVTAAPTLAGPAQQARDRRSQPARRPGVRPARAARIAADTEPGRARAEESGYGFLLLPSRPVPAVRQVGPGPHVTVNDLLITALIVAIGRWNGSHARPSGRIRITMPVNSRPQDQASAAGNLSRLAAVTAQAPADGSGLGALIAEVASATRSAKDHAGPQVDPASRVLAAAWCPPVVKRRLLRLALRTAGPLLCDTSLLSNLGVVAEPLSFGNAPATGLWFSTSAHMPRGLSVGAVTIGGSLHLCLRYRRALFSEPAAARFGDVYAAALDDVTSQGGDGER
jgi:arabinofuranan 3-O-arabinosyltransferase